VVETELDRVAKRCEFCEFLLFNELYYFLVAKVLGDCSDVLHEPVRDPFHFYDIV
jgi:hypothetical protein